MAQHTERSVESLELLRQRGDFQAQRRHVWRLFNQITAVKNGGAPFSLWHGEGDLFSSFPSSRRGLQGFSRHGIVDSQTTNVPVVTYTFYNDAAYDHITRHRLNYSVKLRELREHGERDDAVASNRRVPTFPRSSIVLKTAWWPVARDRVTAMPVWDPEHNPPAHFGNPYNSWQRVVGIEPKSIAGGSLTISFAGTTFPNSSRVGLSSFHHIEVDRHMAKSMMDDPETCKATLIALGRPLQSGDHLVLVAANIAAREIPDWIWGAFWWHDRPERGPYAADRPSSLMQPWRNYLMQPAFDAELPIDLKGEPHISFNPWLEARFPDGGNGGGSVSNCMACHRRASYPSLPFLPVTRGNPDQRDPAYAPGRLRTSFIWALAMHARSN